MFDWLIGAPLAVGSIAPAFDLPDENGRPVSLSALRGKPVVLVFYPGDDTAICTKQLCEIRDDWKSFQRYNAVVYGINGQGAEAHGKFSAKYRFPFPLLVDHGWLTCKEYNAGWGLVRRTVYVIGPDGRILYAKRGKPSTAEILTAMEGLLAKRATS
ncbi:MAG: peroxiredoxin [Bryobacterales bacterium]|nr:peroxiredoxin [Bryobacterales bacterium]